MEQVAPSRQDKKLIRAHILEWLRMHGIDVNPIKRASLDDVLSIMLQVRDGVRVTLPDGRVFLITDEARLQRTLH